MRWPLVLGLLVVPAGQAAGGDVPPDPVAWGPGAITISEGGWGRLARTGGGDWLAVTTIFPAGQPSYLRIFRSIDRGRTWSYQSDVVQSGRKLDNGQLLVLPGGDLLLTGRSLIDGESYRLPVFRSAPAGRAWTDLGNIDSNEGPPGSLNGKGLWEPFLALLPDGRVTALYADEKLDGFSQVVSQKTSPDGGVHWGPEVRAVAEPGGGALRPGMPVLARMDDRRWILVYEVVGLGNADVHCKVSGDGLAWEEGLGTRIPGQHCGPFVVSVADGRLFVSSCENQVSYSEDHGASWMRADPPPWDLGFSFTWPALYEIQEGELGAVATSGGVKVRFGALRPRAVWPDLFQEDFGDGRDEGWTRYGGAFGFTGGRYLLSNSGSYGKALTGSPSWSDGVLEADVLLATSGGDAGLLFRARNPDTTGPDALEGYYAGLDPGAVLLGKMDGGWHPLARVPLVVGLGGWHRVRVVARGARIRVYVDGMTVAKIDLIDRSFGAGQIGVRSFQCDARFDDVTFGTGASFRRSDANADGATDVSDAISIFSYLYLGIPARLPCTKGADANDSGEVDISDGISVLSYVFLGGQAPRPPFPVCGVDPTSDALPCESFPPCP